MKRIRKINNAYTQKKLLFKKIKTYIWIFCVSIMLWCGYVIMDSPIMYANDISEAMVYQKNQQEILKDLLDSELTLYNDSIETMKDILTDEVWGYISRFHPKSKMNPRHIVEECLRTDFDIPLLLSQARLESQFGKRTGGSNSCFGVISRKYETYDESVTDYIRIMQKHYMITRTPEQLIESRFCMEKNPKYKYASDPNYSKTIGSLRTNIIKSTNIVSVYNSIQVMENSRDSILTELNKLIKDRVLD